jgi:hypothetical protein
MNAMKYLLYLFLLPFLLGCAKKKLEIEVVEVECKDLKLSNVRHELITPCFINTQTKPSTYSARIHIDHNNKVACLDQIVVEAKFKNKNGTTAKGSLVKNRFSLSDPEVSFSSSTFSVILTWEINTTHILTFNSAEFAIHSENKIANKSNVIHSTVSNNCEEAFTTIDGSEIKYELVGQVDLTSPNAVAKFYDFASDDNDIIDVYINGIRVVRDLEIFNKGESFVFNLSPGVNTMVVIAKNEGVNPPNTCGIAIGNQVFSLTPSLKTGQALELILN